MIYTLGQAAKVTGRGKATIQRAIVKGVISAIKDHNGAYQIDPSELHRIFPPVSSDQATEQGLKQHDTSNETRMLEREVEMLRELITRLETDKADLRTDRDHWREEAAQVRRILTDQSAKPVAEAAAGFWKRLFRKG